MISSIAPLNSNHTTKLSHTTFKMIHVIQFAVKMDLNVMEVKELSFLTQFISCWQKYVNVKVV